MLQKSGRLVLWEAMFILELHSAETQDKIGSIRIFQYKLFTRKLCLHSVRKYRVKAPEGLQATERQEG